jgi:hypothetical protein
MPKARTLTLEARRCMTAPATVNLLLFIVALCSNLALPVDYENATYFIDSQDYLRQSRAPLLTTEFLVPSARPGFYPRAIMVPVIYKLGGSNPATIIAWQKVIHSLATLVIASALLTIIRTKPAQLFVLVLAYLLMSWWSVVGWTTMLLSEALSFDALLCWISSILFFYVRPTRFSFALQLPSIAALALTRDTWPYVLVAFYSVATLVWILLRRRYLRLLVILLAITVLMLVLQDTSAAIGQRSRLPLLNSIVMRILPNTGWRQWLAQHGMPQVNELAGYFEGKTDRIHALYALYTDESFVPLDRWLDRNGKTVYARFLLTHPSYTLLLRETRDDLRPFGTTNNVSLYIGSAKGYSRLASHLFPFTTLRRFAVIFVAVLGACYYFKQRRFLIVPALAAFTAFQAIIVYDADGLEVDRHLVATQPLIELIALIGIGLLLDVAISVG